MTNPDSISASLLIPAPAQDLFDVVANPTLHHVIDGSGTVKGSRNRITKLELGDKFSTSMRMFVPYVIRNKVTEFIDGELIAWAHIGGWTWRYEFVETDGGTEVTETFDWSTASKGAARYIRAAGFDRRNASSMEATLGRLAAYAERKNLGRRADDVAAEDHAATALLD